MPLEDNFKFLCCSQTEALVLIATVKDFIVVSDTIITFKKGIAFQISQYVFLYKWLSEFHLRLESLN